MQKNAILTLFLTALFSCSKYSDLPNLKLSADFDLASLDKENWVQGKIEMSNAGKDSFSSQKIRFKGRGNSTWDDCAKKSYAVKFEAPRGVFASGKGKNYVLLANYLDLSFLKNDIAFHIAKRLGFDFVPKGDFVHLFFNGKHQGLYWFGEKVEASESRVKLDAGDALLEIDGHFDEKWKFESRLKKLPYMLKNDSGMTEDRLAKISARVDEIETVLYDEKSSDKAIGEVIDFTSFAKCFILQIAIMRNSDFSRPNSFFCVLSDGKLKVPTVWDFDFSFIGLHAEQCAYFDVLRKSDRFKREVKRIWTLSGITKDEILNYVQVRAKQIEKASRLDGKIWEAHAPARIWRGNLFSDFTFEKDIEKIKKSLTANFDEFESHLAVGDIE